MKYFFFVLVAALMSGCLGNDIKPVQQAQLASNGLNQCDSPNHYRKSLLMMGWQIDNADDVFIPPKVNQRYVASLRAMLKPDTIQIYDDFTTVMLNTPATDRSYPSIADQVVHFANKSGAQYVVDGRIRLVEGELSGWAELADRFDFRLVGSRQTALVMDVNIYDGATGARVATSAFAMDTNVARADLINSYDSTTQVISGYFGDATEIMLLAQSNFIQSTMHCLPLQANVIRKYRESIIVDVGHYHRVKVGDRFKVARRQDWGQYRAFDKTLQFGDFAVIEITQVGMDSSIARVVDDAPQDVELNDLVVASH